MVGFEHLEPGVPEDQFILVYLVRHIFIVITYENRYNH